MISDENLADQAVAIAEVDVLSVTAVEDTPFQMVEYTVLAERELKGTLNSHCTVPPLSNSTSCRSASPSI
jgi:hypothetical protein